MSGCHRGTPRRQRYSPCRLHILRHQTYSGGNCLPPLCLSNRCLSWQFVTDSAAAPPAAAPTKNMVNLAPTTATVIKASRDPRQPPLDSPYQTDDVRSRTSPSGTATHGNSDAADRDDGLASNVPTAYPSNEIRMPDITISAPRARAGGPTLEYTRPTPRLHMSGFAPGRSVGFIALPRAVQNPPARVRREPHTIRKINVSPTSIEPPSPSQQLERLPATQLAGMLPVALL